MTLVRLLPERFHGITKEVAKFGTIGVINFAVNLGVFNLLLLTFLSGSEAKAKAVAALVATTCAYFMNRHWTYRDRPKSTLRREYSLFFLFNLVGLTFEVGTVWFTKYVLDETSVVWLNVSSIVGIGLGTLFRFWAYRTHVFKAATDEPLPSTSLQLAAAVADAEPQAELEEVRAKPAGPAPRVLVTAIAPGTVVLKIVDEPAGIDEIELDGMVALAEQPAELR